MTAPIFDRLAGLQKARQVRPGAWIGACPAHEDVNPSLTWTTGEGGAALLKCHAGCSTEAVVNAVDMTMADLFEPTAKPEPTRQVARYDYQDADGNLVFQVVRTEPKSFRQRRPDGHGGWVWNRDGVKPVLYQLPELRAAARRGVLVVEGEKDVDRLRALGFVATCNVGGAGKWRGEYAEELRGRKVTILPDNDEPGRQHADDVARSLFGVASEVRILALPELPPKGDVSDWLGMGGTAERLKQLIVEQPPLSSPPPDSLRETSEIGERTHAGTPLSSHHSLVSQSEEWPQPPDDAAFAGLAGELVDLSDPHTEADRVAVLVQHLVTFGNVVGRGPHQLVGATRHGTNENVVLVGRTGKARKGDSFEPVLALYKLAEPIWSADCITGGLGSGEGLIWAVRDPVEKVSAKTGEVETVDPGVADKRLLVFEPEMARILRVAGRQGSILSMVVRDAWDRGDLRAMSKNSPARATGAHVSMIAHTTTDELGREMADVEAFNGFANRYMWLAVRRSKQLPEPEPFGGTEVVEMATELAARISTAWSRDRVARDPEARELWAAEYSALSAERPGLLGSVLARAEAHVLRLSLIYALLDNADSIRARHLQSALALWRYVERSALYIFGDVTGDPIADTIMRAVREAPDGVSRTQISALFSRHESPPRIDHALGVLLASGRARRLTRETGGRPVEVWVAS